MATPELDDYRWLAREDARRYLASASDDNRSTVALIRSLRKDLSPSRAHLVVEQIELRSRAKQKFRDADQMLFTRKLLEQATDEQSAQYKAGRFPRDVTVIDLCCGLGGDLLALADRGPSLGVDIDPISALLADANCRRLGRTSGSAKVGDAGQPPIEPGMLWHLDPDRRSQGTRSINIEFWEPGAEVLRELIARHPDGAIKLAPATVLPEDVGVDVQCEWIGQPRTCRQQVAWFGRLARHPGRHSATVLGREAGEPSVSITGQPDQAIPVAPRLGAYVHEPHAALLASRLAGALAAELRITAVTQGVAYLTSDRSLADDVRLSSFEVLAVLPFDIRQVKAAIRERRMGDLEIKHRGLQLDPDVLRKRLRVPGDNSGCLIVVGGREQTSAILTRRLVGGSLSRPDGCGADES